MRVFALALVAGVAVSAASAQQLFVMGVDSTANAAHLFDPNDGSLVQENYLEWGSLTDGGSSTSSTAIKALQVGNQIWVSDQLRDLIYRFDLDGQHLGSIGNAGIDNIRGMQVVGNQVWVTNIGSNQGAPGNALVQIDIATASVVGSVPLAVGAWDIVHYQDKLLVSNSSNNNLEFYDATTGAFVSTFHEPTPPGLRFPQQLFVTDEGTVLAAGFSAAGGNVSGVFEFDALGNQVGIIAGEGFGPRGVIQLGNGEIMWSNGAGFWVGNGNVFGGSGRYLTYVQIPAPSGMAALALGGLVATRRRR